MNESPVQVNDFIRQREKDWQRLEMLIAKRQGRAPLSADDVRELGQLYRAVASDLALARRDYPDQRVTIFLNGLLTRAHSFIYQQDVSDFRQFVRYFTHTIPQAFRQNASFVLVAFLLFIVPAVVGFRLTSLHPHTGDALGLTEQRRLLAERETWTDIPVEQRPYASAFIMSNNIRVAILAFGGGAAFGVFTLYVLVFNGLVIGGVLGLAAHYEMSDTLVAFIVGHGVVELSIIFMAGGAGLALGWALLNPGAYSRRDALSLAARRVVPLVVLAIPLLIVAGLIEGYLSPTDTPFALRAGVGIVTGIMLYLYLFSFGRDKGLLKDL
jgi:uncharacterized membrane protein SpoIIM required for sporulation